MIRHENLTWDKKAMDEYENTKKKIKPIFEEILSHGFNHNEATYIIFTALNEVENFDILCRR